MTAPILKTIKELKLKAVNVREDCVKMLLPAKSGHTAGPLGMADVFTAIYFSGVANIDPQNPDWPDRDRIVLSNGHICPVLYATLAEAGYYDKALMSTLRQFGSPLQGHPHKGSLPGIEASSGPLAQGLSLCCGMALAARMNSQKHFIFALTSDGEQQEGQTWEAVMLAGKYKLSHIIALMDRNFIQIDGTTEDVMPVAPLPDKYRAFNWNVMEIDGNDMRQIVEAIQKAKAYADTPGAKPTMIIANTVPSKGISFAEGKYQWHGKPPNAEEAQKALAELAAERAKIQASN